MAEGVSFDAATRDTYRFMLVAWDADDRRNSRSVEITVTVTG